MQILAQLFPAQRNYLPFLLGLVALFTFWRLGSHPIYEWDEARYGENAYWMLQTGDFINYQYAGEADDWNAKPPLMVWLIAGSFQLFGYHEWALRLPSALAILGFFWIFYNWVRRYRSPRFAFVAGLMLLSCKGIIGHHIGRTGDTDALLLLTLMGFVYACSAYLDEGHKTSTLWASLWLGLAFYTKGPAFLLVLPGVGLYLILRGKLGAVLRDPWVWSGLGLMLGIIASWFGLVQVYGVQFSDPDFIGKNSWEVMIWYDTWARFTQPGIEGGSTLSNAWTYVFSALDAKFNLWQYFSYLGLLLWAWRSYQQKMSFPATEPRFLLWAASLWLGMALILTLSQSKLPWYISPALPFAAIFATEGAASLVRWRAFLLVPVLLLGLFLLGRQAYELHHLPERRSSLVQAHQPELHSVSRIWLYHLFTQDIRLYVDWTGAEIRYLDKAENWPKRARASDALVGLFSPTEQAFIEKLPGWQGSCQDSLCVFLAEKRPTSGAQ